MLCRTLRILVDESVAHPFEAELTALDVATVRDPGWSGLRNGVLLRAAVDAGFDVLITRDRSLPYQHNLRRIGISVLVLTGVRNRVEELRMLVPQILSILPLLRPGDAYEIAPLPGDAMCDRETPLRHRAASRATGVGR